MRHSCLPILALFLFTSTALAAQPSVTASAVTDIKTLKPGDPFTLAVTLTTESHWHIYWRNPGDAGTPTHFKLDLPEGFSASEPQFPLPIEFKQAGNLVAYGYTGSATFLFHITTPKNFSATSADIAINANWLCCNDEKCVPGKQKISLSLPIATESSPDSAARNIIKSVALPADAPPPSVTIAPQPPTTLSNIKAPFAIQLTWKSPVKNVEVFPYPNDTLELAKPAVTHNLNATTITATARLLSPANPPDKQEFLITYIDDAGKRHGFTTAVTLPAPSKSK